MGHIRLFLKAFLLVLCTSLCGQNVYYSDDSEGYKILNDKVIETSKQRVSLSWTTSDSFYSPFVVVQKTETGDTLSELRTQLSSAIINTSILKNGKIEIKAESGRKIEVGIVYSSESNFIPIIYIGIGIALLIMLLVLRVHRKKAKAMSVSKMESISTRRTQKFECVTVLFADIQGFTKIAETMNPEQLVDELDRYFIYFDELVEKYSVEKIKTIGDSYMCAGGVPDIDSANPIEVVLVALGMIAYVNNRQSMSRNFWNIRVGINTGPVISGTLGYKKKAFDIWGDSVNIASRMESSSEPGEINITSDTYELIKDYFECEYRGKMPVKYKGEIDMYFVKRLRPEFSEGGSLYKPNVVMLQQIQLLKIRDMADLVFSKIDEIGAVCFRNRFESLMASIELLTEKQGVDVFAKMTCKVALIMIFVSTELPKSCSTLSSELSSLIKKMHFSEEQIMSIFKIVNRAVQDKKPSNREEELIHDAIYEYIGSRDFEQKISDCCECAMMRNTKESKKEWYRNLKKSMTVFQYYTLSANEVSEVLLADQLKNLDKIIRKI